MLASSRRGEKFFATLLCQQAFYSMRTRPLHLHDSTSETLGIEHHKSKNTYNNKAIILFIVVTSTIVPGIQMFFLEPFICTIHIAE